MGIEVAGNAIARAVRDGEQVSMNMSSQQPLWKLLGILFKPHPWHGISPGELVPEVVQCFIEVVPSDTLKYEIDKISGYLKVDRPQKYSNICPVLYGFIPQTFCGKRWRPFRLKRPVENWKGTMIR